jgi:hypothetical protein
MNSNEQIERNKSVTYLPEFFGLTIFKKNQNIIFLQEDREFTVPIAMASALIIAINKAKGVDDES